MTSEIGSIAMSPWKKFLLIGLVSVLALSTGARALMSSPSPEKPASSELSSSLTSNGKQVSLPDILGLPTPEAAEPEPEPTALESALPYISEGSFFALIGFALGYASKKIVKLMLIFLAIFFLGIQALSYGDVLAVDWSKAVDMLNGWILNLKENETITEVLKDKVPTAGAMVAGYWLGFRRG